MSREALSQLDAPALRTLYGKVLLYAKWRVGSTERAAGLAQQAFDLAMTTRPWRGADGGGARSLANHLMGIVDSVRSHELTSRRAVYERDAGRALALAAGDVALSPEALAIAIEEDTARARRQRKLFARLRAALAGHPLETRILDCMAAGVMEPSLQVEQTGASIDAVYRARERIRRFAERVRAEEPDAGEDGSEDGSEDGT
jgi:hypothetical protein